MSLEYHRGGHLLTVCFLDSSAKQIFELIEDKEATAAIQINFTNLVIFDTTTCHQFLNYPLLTQSL